MEDDMCLAVPAEVVELMAEEMALVETGGVRKVVSIMLLEGVQEGDFVLVHAGFALEKVDREEAERTLALLEEAAESGPLFQ